MPVTTEPTIVRSAAYFPVEDVARLGAWYRDVLGFACDYAAGDPPEFAIYSRGASVVMLRQVADATRLRPSEAQGGTWDVFCWVTALDALHRDLEGKGADIVSPPTVQPYGMREFAIRDPAGHVWGFGEQEGGDR
jgi:uncharacterized glyoxalase superfamily protein PhnB